MRDMPTASFLMWSLMVSHTLTMNWWGITKMRMSAPFTDSAKSGTANWRRERKYVETLLYITTPESHKCNPRVFVYHIGGQLVAGQIFHILVVVVDDFCEFTSVHRLLEHPHVHCGVEPVILGCVGTHNLGNGRAPVYMEGHSERQRLVVLQVSQKRLNVLMFSVMLKLYIGLINGPEVILETNIWKSCLKSIHRFDSLYCVKEIVRSNVLTLLTLVSLIRSSLWEWTLSFRLFVLVSNSWWLIKRQ